jgi:hypothetical protein
LATTNNIAKYCMSYSIALFRELKAVISRTQVTLNIPHEPLIFVSISKSISRYPYIDVNIDKDIWQYSGFNSGLHAC